MSPCQIGNPTRRTSWRYAWDALDERVAALLSRFPRLAPGVELATLLMNGAVAVRIDPDGEFDTALNFAIEEGRISRIYAVRNPHKLGRLARIAELRR